MTPSTPPVRFGRRSVLTGGLAALAVGMTASVAGCATGGPIVGSDTVGSEGPKTAENPFGMAADSAIEVVVFNGGYGTEYAEFSAEQLRAKHAGVEIKISPSANIGQELQPRFTGGNPPDMFNNSGSGSIALRSILDQVEDLKELMQAPNHEGVTIADTLYPGTIEAGSVAGKMAHLPYVLSVFTTWYSASLFAQNGWEPPRSWDETLALGAKAAEQDKYLFCWGKEAATYYLKMAIISAIKGGGDEVRLTLDRLEPNCWSHPAVQQAFVALETCVAKGYFAPGGAGTQFTAAQARWSDAQEVLLYPSGSWIENEMKDQTADGFEMTGFPVAMADPDNGAMPFESMFATASTSFLVPTQARNPAGGKEFLRAMLSPEAARNFARTTMAATVVRDTVPADAFGSTALASQIAMLDKAGSNTFSYIHGIYGMETDQAVVWNSFLSGKTDAAGLTRRLQEITDDIANDDSIEKVEVT
ncbi:N-acetylglucosamine/diacetylchitobiose ABC transporter substrate-binding protein [Propionibacteriaceae bacterium Y1700]|uniref:N-acetylglucosamine/diacetylchitobiose ABC transporter substrate-binding protein n=1 Tax=Microlunatus sp. Y1700 TaxID=3418487 RepID=UPI003DA7157A